MRREGARDAGRARGGPRRRRAAALAAELEAGGAIPVLVEGTQRRTTLQTADTHSTFPGTRESDFETTARGAGGGGMPVILRISKTKSVLRYR